MMPRPLGGEGIDPMALALARMIGAALFFFAISTALHLRQKVTATDQLRLAGLSLLGIVGNQTLFLMGLRSTTPVSAALLSVTIPVFTAAMSVILGAERPSARLWIGLGIAACGVLWLTGVKTVDRGAALVSINSVLYSAYVVLSQKLVRKLGAVTVITWIFTWGALLFLPFSIGRLAHDVPTWSPRAACLVAYIIAMPTVVAYALNAWALGKTAPSLVTVYIFLQPVIAGALAWVQLGQPPPMRALYAAVLISIGVFVVAARGPIIDAERTSPRG